MQTPLTTRFAPSPTGALHLGHALSASLAQGLARRTGGRFLVRIEDIDTGRCRPEYEAGILDDLAWLGLAWDGPVRRQSEHMDRYRRAIDALVARELAYPCFCTRGDIAREIAAMASAPQARQGDPSGPAEGAPYPGTCRHLDARARADRLRSGAPYALRLDVTAAVRYLGARLTFMEHGRGPAGEHGLIPVQPQRLGDLVLARRDVGVSYHLAVVLDDADQQVTRVTRGEDLFAATHVQRLLQALLGLPEPGYHHHPLVRAPDGRRLAKRDRDSTLRALRESGHTPGQVLGLVAAASGGLPG